MAKGKVGNRSLTKGTSDGQSVNDWTTGGQSENGSNHKCVYCNYPLFIWEIERHYKKRGL